MPQSPGVRPDAPRIIDTRGDASFTSTYMAVVLTEVAVLAALWFFSRYFRV